VRAAQAAAQSAELVEASIAVAGVTVDTLDAGGHAAKRTGHTNRATALVMNVLIRFIEAPELEKVDNRSMLVEAPMQ
jgi:hypothetical protein